MSSTYPRSQIVLDALSLAGRGSELKASCNQWLNYWLLDVGLTFRFPELRKIGPTLTLAQGSNTIPLPSDFGAGMEKQGMVFGSDNKPMDELSYEEFAQQAGIQPTFLGPGRPNFYIVDKNAGVFRFSMTADQAYPATPTYFIQPPLLPVDFSYDSQKIWMDNDILAVQGLVQMIYQFTKDEREFTQEQKVTAMLNKWKRETVKMGGTSRVLPSPGKFKTQRFGGLGFGP